MVERIVAGIDDYRTLAAAKLRSDWQYRTGFVAMLASTLLVTAMDFVGIAVIFTKTPELGGWTFREVAFLYGVAGVSFGLADFLVGSVEQISPRVRTGVFDLLLIRPVNALVHLTASEFNFRRIGKVAQALIVLVVATAIADIEWTLGRIVMLPLAIVSGTVIACATWVITASIAFFTVETQEIANTFTYGGDLAASYPLHIFESWLRVLVTYLFPSYSSATCPPCTSSTGRHRSLFRRGCASPLPSLRSPWRSSPGRCGEPGSATTDRRGAEVTAVVDARALTKTFVVRTKAGRLRRERREIVAVAGIDLRITAGEMVGYIGPNGAGKSTTIKMMTGVLTPSAGTVRVLGLDPITNRVALVRRIGVVFGQRTQLWWDLPLRDSFGLLQAVYRTDPRRHQANLAAFVDLLDLGPLLDVPVRQLSLGQRMRGELTAALLHDPTLVFLDEPTIGLDVVSKHAVRRFLAEVNRTQGTTVVLTTHDLADIEQLCERMIIIDHGHIVHDGPLESFRVRHGTQRTVVVDLEVEGPPLEVPHTTVVRVEGARQWLRFDRDVTSAAAVVAAVVALRPIRDVAIEEPAIEELVRELYERGGGA